MFPTFLDFLIFSFYTVILKNNSYLIKYFSPIRYANAIPHIEICGSLWAMEDLFDASIV